MQTPQVTPGVVSLFSATPPTSAPDPIPPRPVTSDSVTPPTFAPAQILPHPAIDPNSKPSVLATIVPAPSFDSTTDPNLVTNTPLFPIQKQTQKNQLDKLRKVINSPKISATQNTDSDDLYSGAKTAIDTSNTKQMKPAITSTFPEQVPPPPLGSNYPLLKDKMKKKSEELVPVGNTARNMSKTKKNVEENKKAVNPAEMVLDCRIASVVIILTLFSSNLTQCPKLSLPTWSWPSPPSSPYYSP